MGLPIRLKRGKKNNISDLKPGEIAYATDKDEFLIGLENGKNMEIPKNFLSYILNQQTRSGLPPIGHEYGDFITTQHPPQRKPMIGFILDDGYDNHYTLRDIFESNDVKASIALCTDWIDGISEYSSDTEHMTWEQARELAYDYGWEISNHSKTHASFNNNTVEELKQEVFDSNKRFLEEGLYPKHFTYPGGAYGGFDLEGEEKRALLSKIYTMAYILGDDYILRKRDNFTIPRVIADEEPMSYLEEKIDEAIDNNTGLVFCIHQIIDDTVENEGASEVSTEKIQQLIDYARDNGAEVGLPSEVVRYSGLPYVLKKSYKTIYADAIDSPSVSGALEQGLVGKYEIKANAGSKLFNTALNQNHADLYGVSWGVDNDVVYIDFTGDSGEYGVIDSSFGDCLKNNEFSLACWINFNSLDRRHIIYDDWKYSSGDDRSIRLEITNNNSIKVDLSEDGTSENSYDVTTGDKIDQTDKWHFIAVTYNSGSIYIRAWDVSKMLIATDSSSGPSTINVNTTKDKHIGKYDEASETMNAKLGELWFFNRDIGYETLLRYLWRTTRQKYQAMNERV